MRGRRFLEAELQDMDRVLSGRYVSTPYFCLFHQIQTHLRVNIQAEL